MLTQTSEYALRAMVCLACQRDRLSPTPELARLADVPQNYLAKVLQMLASADLVTGRRGVGGGYRLSREPADIKLLEIVNAVDSGRWLRVAAPSENPALASLQETLQEASNAIRRVLGQTTLGDVLDRVDGSGPAVVHNMAS